MSEVDDELKLGKEALDDLKIMEDASLRRRYTTLYFAVYHTARAALISMGYAPKTHSGLDSLIHNILVRQEGLLKEKEAMFFSKLKSRREQADYETGFYGSEAEFLDLSEEAKDLIESLKDVAEKFESG